MVLNLEELRPTPSMKIPKKNLSFKGHSLLCRYDTIASGEKQHKIRFLKSALPEQMIILCVDKNILAGQFNFSGLTITNATKYLLASNLSSVDLMYEGHEMSIKAPNFEQFDKGPISTQILHDTLQISGLMTMKVEKEKITYTNCTNEFKDTPFPFNVIDYTLQDNTKARVYPNDATSNQSIYAKDGNIELNLTFGSTGAPASAVFLFFFVYSGDTLTYDVRLDRFVNLFSNLKTLS